MHMSGNRGIGHVVVMVLMFVRCRTILRNMGPYRQLLLNLHNRARAQWPASNMKLMTWDRRLEAIAGRWTERCYFDHQMIGFGENLAFVSSTAGPVSDNFAIRNGFRNWYEEYRIWGGGNSFCGQACHFTQIIWAQTSRVGCALSYCPVINDRGRLNRNAMYLACFYSPQGNFVGQAPFTPGPPCSRCPRGNICIRGLCAGPDGPLRRGRRRRSVKEQHWICYSSYDPCKNKPGQKLCHRTCQNSIHARK